MDSFLSCDWGTSSFRLRLVRTQDLLVLGEIRSASGISDTFRQWKERRAEADSRQQFYAAVLRGQLTLLSEQLDRSLEGIPVILSGMASSTVGIQELPYKKLPFRLDGSDLLTETLHPPGLDNGLILVSGARTDGDVMRGEETKIVGCLPALKSAGGRQLLILPGTHPKHVRLDAGYVTGFRTYMTGEFFDLLSRHSILAVSVAEGGAFHDAESERWFAEGVIAGRTSGLLYAAFGVRINELLRGVPKTANYYYLSGLLIGTELAQVGKDVPVYLVAGASHAEWYGTALRVLGVSVERTLDADEALVEGQRTVLASSGKIHG